MDSSQDRLNSERRGGVSSSLLGPAHGALTRWRVSTWATLVLTGAYLVVCVGRLVVLIRDRQLVDRMAADPGSSTLRDVLDIANAESTVTVLYTLTMFAYIFAFVVFFVTSRQLLRRLGYDPRSMMRHWSVAAWRIGILVSLVLAITGRTPSIDTADPGWAAAWHSTYRERILFAALRVLVAVLFIVAVWVLRTRIFSLIASRPVPTPALPHP